MVDTNLPGKVALVTDASQGMGRRSRAAFTARARRSRGSWATKRSGSFRCPTNEDQEKRA